MGREHVHEKKGPVQEHGHKGDHDHGYHIHMVADFRRRFWVSLVVTLPILVLSPMIQRFRPHVDQHGHRFNQCKISENKDIRLFNPGGFLLLFLKGSAKMERRKAR
jgi:hypothetical protein